MPWSDLSDGVDFWGEGGGLVVSVVVSVVVVVMVFVSDLVVDAAVL